VIDSTSIDVYASEATVLHFFGKSRTGKAAAFVKKDNKKQKTSDETSGETSSVSE
jgi:hypothetical protein